ncbi:uncharacterized protein LOC124257686 [Haliotis rubra]|uniref:uncharacterized protein LOC124257686 n=1 Tax=Haliotis rubra TaxID=36100 RepID=UPI001EE57C25|nr:uncharacterized protein LOC124257686 [Haliotis rubra]
MTKMSCNWLTEEYFSHLIGGDKKSHSALEMLVDDLHTSKESTIGRFLCHSGSEDFLWGLVRLLGSDIPRVAGNSAYIIGTLAESDIGCFRVLALAKGRKSNSGRILKDLTRMLTFDDPESVMNAAGTMGTLAESNEGRNWILSSDCVDAMLDNVTALLHTDNLWTASNAALVIARLCISEDGCSKILNNPNYHHILSKLVLSLGVDEAGRGMNAAFAIGRLCDMDVGRKRLLSLHESEKMISSLAKMLSCEDTGASKNACFALSCLATNSEGHSRLLNNAYVDEVLRTLSELLSAEDSETGWFAAMTLRTLASQPKGCLKLRENHTVHLALKAMEVREDMNPDLREEVIITLEILKRLEKPAPPHVQVTGPYSLRASWDKITTKSGFDVRYQLFEGGRCVYNGRECSCEVNDLSPYTQYSLRMRACTEGDESQYTDTVQVTTEEAEPSAPVDLKILGSTITQLKVGWDPPEHPNGVLKGYNVFYGRNIVDHTADVSIILTSLTANTSYEVQVYAATSKGKGERSSVIGTTAELGAHAPSRPQVHVLGRNEVNLTWGPPEVPLGRITRYDVIMNGKTVYSGTDLCYNARRLTPDTEYTFVVVALTNEGKFESKATKKRTSKDEYDTNRPPLYQPPKRESVTEEMIPKVIPLQKKRKSLTEGKPVRVPSAKNRSKTPTNTENIPPRPSSAGSLSPRRGSQVLSDSSSQAEDSQITPVQRAVPVPKPVPAEPKKEARPSSLRKDRTSRISSTSSTTARDSSHRAIKVDKSPTVPKTMFPVAISYVSIHGGDDFDMTFDPSRSPEFYIKKRGGPAEGSSLKLERSRTSYIGPKHPSKHKGLLTDLDLSEEPLDVTNSGSKALGVDRGGKSSLPKPSVPSQQYLEGGRSVTFCGENNRGSKSIQSPRGGYDASREVIDMDQLDQEFQKSKRPASHHSAYSSAGSVLPSSGYTVAPYFIESHHEFLQRTNTFISSHRPGLKKTLDRLPNKMSFPINVAMATGPVTFSPEIPENKVAKSHNKFVPMQLRTQPGNLPPAQLQRVSTALAEPRVIGGFPARRLESLPRSHTQVAAETKGPHSSVKRGKNHGTGGASDVDAAGVSGHHSNTKEKLSRSKGSSHRRLNQSGHIREPDSVLLSQSWTFKAQEEALQGAR